MSCYKVILADKNDDIVDIRASLFVGVAKQVCAQEKRKTRWAGNLGILSSKECIAFTDALKTLLQIEDALFKVVNIA